MNLWQTTAVLASGVTQNSDAGRAVTLREKVLLQTHAAEDAVMRPSDTGPWSHGLRAALAARIARLNQDTELSAIYLKGFEQQPEAALAEPGEDGIRFELQEVISFMDRVAVQPRDIKADEIETLKNAGVGDADIVRLCELNAFLSYQIRLVAGLRLIDGEQA